MANPSLQIGNDNWAIKEDNLLGYSTAGTRFVPQPITMTRATLGTRVNPSGLVEDVELLGSELVTNGDFSTNIDFWRQYNSVSTWDNGTIKTTSNSTVAWIRQNDILTTGNSYKITFKAKASNISQKINIWDGANFISTNLSFDSINVYKEFTYTLDFIGSGGQHLILGQQVIGNGDTINFDNVSAKQLIRDNLPRVDYTDGTSSLLVEPQRTNIVTYSEDFSNSYWTKSGATVTSDSITSLDGTQNADLLLEEVNNSRHIFWDNAVVSGGDYTVSIFLKKQNNRYVFFQSGVDNATDRYGIIYDFDGGVVTDTNSKGSPTNTSYKVEQHINGWVKLSITQTHTSGDVYLICGGSDTAIPTYNVQKEPVYTGNASNGFYAWGAQLEQGSYSTSYIPTSGWIVTRNQETYTKTGISDLINDSEGVLFAEIAALANDGTSRRISLSDGSISNRVSLELDETANKIKVFISLSGTSQILEYTATNLLQFNKIAIKYKINDFAIWFNGTEVATDFSGDVPTGMNELSFTAGSTSHNFDGKVKQLQVFKTADIDLAALTS